MEDRPGGPQVTVEAPSPPASHQPTDRPLNPFREPRKAPAVALVVQAMGMVEDFEQAHGLRQRKRRREDRETFRVTVGAVVCDLLHRHLTSPTGWVSVSLSHQHLGMASRYRAPAMNKTLPVLLDRLASLGLVVMEKGHQGFDGPGRRTVLQAGPALLALADHHGVTLADLGQSRGQELVILKREKVDYWDDGGRLEYADTPETQAFRSQVVEINEWLAGADIELTCPVQYKDGSLADANDRHLRRYFTLGSFENGGRLFGGFWQPMAKWQRRKAIQIEGEEVTTLDYSQMGPRILYGLTTGSEPEGDAYYLPGLERHRAGIKKVLSAALFADQPLTRFPRDTKEMFPAGVSMSQVVGKLAERHEPIRHHLFTGIGHRMQFIESEIMVSVLLTMKERGIIGLPIHDAVITPVSAKEEVTTIMGNVFRHHTGVTGLVTEEGT